MDAKSGLWPLSWRQREREETFLVQQSRTKSTRASQKSRKRREKCVKVTKTSDVKNLFHRVLSLLVSIHDSHSCDKKANENLLLRHDYAKKSLRHAR